MSSVVIIFLISIVFTGFLILCCYVCKKTICKNDYRHVQATNISSSCPPQSGFRINGRDTSSLHLTSSAPALGFGHPVDMPQPELSMTTVTPHLNAEPPYPVEDTLYPPSRTRYSSEGHQDVPVCLSNRSCPYPPDSNLNEMPRAPYPVELDTNTNTPTYLNRLPYPPDPILDDITSRNLYPPYPTDRRTNNIPTVDDIAHRTPYPPDPNSRVFTTNISGNSFGVPYLDTGPRERTSFRQHTNVTPYPPNRSFDSRDLHTTNLANNDPPPSYTEAMRNSQHL